MSTQSFIYTLSSSKHICINIVISLIKRIINLAQVMKLLVLLLCKLHVVYIKHIHSYKYWAWIVYSFPLELDIQWNVMRELDMAFIAIGIIKVRGFLQKVPPTNPPNIYFLTAWKHWLGIAKPKNVFRSTLILCIKLPWNFKNSYLTDFSTDWLMPSDNRNCLVRLIHLTS